MKNKAEAIKRGRKMLGGDRCFFVYQFPRGHWGYASENSPVGNSLVESGMIYPTLGIEAMQWEEAR